MVLFFLTKNYVAIENLCNFGFGSFNYSEFQFLYVHNHILLARSRNADILIFPHILFDFAFSKINWKCITQKKSGDRYDRFQNPEIDTIVSMEKMNFRNRRLYFTGFALSNISKNVMNICRKSLFYIGEKLLPFS